MTVTNPPANAITESAVGINLLDGQVAVDSNGVIPCDAAWDSQMTRARQAGLPLIIPPGMYKRTTPLLLMAADTLSFPTNWIQTTILFAFTTPQAAIQILDPTELTAGVRIEGACQITGDSVNTTVGMFLPTIQKWDCEWLHIGRGFTLSGIVYYGQRWLDESQTSAGVASSTPPKGLLTAPVGAADNTVSLTNTLQYQDPVRWPWGFSIAKLITPKTTLAANLTGAARTVRVTDATTLTNAGAIMLAGSGEVIYYTGKLGNTLTGCIRTYYGHISTVVAGAVIYQAELVSYTGKSSTQLTGVTRGIRNTTAIAHGADVNAPTTLNGSATAGSLAAGTYFFVVEALNGTLQSIASNEFSITVGASAGVSLTWAAPSGTVTGYRLHIGTATGRYVASIDVGNTLAFTYTGQATTNTGPPFGVFQNPGSATRSRFGKVDIECGTVPILWTGTFGLDVTQTTTLSGNAGSIAPGTTTINFAAAGPLNAYAGVDGPAGTTIVQIDSELIQGTVSGASLINCTRGLYMTTAATHTDGTSAYAVFRRNGGDANQMTIEDLLVQSNLVVTEGCWFMQGAGNHIVNANVSASNPGGDAYRFDWYSNTIGIAVTGPVGSSSFEFNFNDAGDLSGDNIVLNHDVEGGSPSNYGAAAYQDSAGRNTVIGYRNGLKMRRVGTDHAWLAANDLLWDNAGILTWRNPSSVDARVATELTAAPQIPGLVTPFTPHMANAATVAVANEMFASRVIIPKTGTLHDLSVFVSASSGNLRVGVYDTGDASAGNRSRLFDSGSVAAGAASSWQIVGDPALAVTQGQELDFAVIADNAVISWARFGDLAAAQSQLPANFWPVTGGASPKFSWFFNVGSFTLPATVAEANCSPLALTYLIIGRVA